jgi:hypothetical protein
VNTVGVEASVLRNQHTETMQERYGLSEQEAAGKLYIGAEGERWIGNKFNFADDLGYFTEFDGSRSRCINLIVPGFNSSKIATSMEMQIQRDAILGYIFKMLSNSIFHKLLNNKKKSKVAIAGSEPAPVVVVSATTLAFYLVRVTGTGGLIYNPYGV